MPRVNWRLLVYVAVALFGGATISTVSAAGECSPFDLDCQTTSMTKEWIDWDEFNCNAAPCPGESCCTMHYLPKPPG